MSLRTIILSILTGIIVDIILLVGCVKYLGMEQNSLVVGTFVGIIVCGVVKGIQEYPEYK